ncbi:MAG: 4Fe-4S binding protein [Thermodesulfobacteriota bacterium]|nr:4Fe-4S binding protein [Thermodesulfobacteriota bacterium]
MKIEIDLEKCIGEGYCVQICPNEVLELKDEKSHVVNMDACTECRACEVACDYEALKCIEE